MTIFHGWNDHWASFGIEDKDIGSYNLGHPLVVVYASQSRLVQLINSAYVRIMLSDLETDRRPERVNVGDYRNNLTEMVRLSLANDIVPVLVTAPSSHTVGDEPAFLADRWLNDIRELVPIHQQSLQLVREVAQENGVPLLDLARTFEGYPLQELKSELFQMDGIHLQVPGDEVIAETMYEFFKEEGLLELLKN